MIELTQQAASQEVAKYIGKAGYYHCAAYDTTLIISDEPFHHLDLFNRKILWINQVANREHGNVVFAARAVIPCKSADDFDGVLVMNKLATLLCYITHGQPTNPITWAGTGFAAAIVGQPRRLQGGMLYSHDQIDSLLSAMQPDKLSNEKWIALAHFRQGIAAQTPYFEFLSHWKILELRFNNDRPSIKSYVNSFLSQHPELTNKLHDPQTADAEDLLRRTRNSSAHFALFDKAAGDKVQNPDDPNIYLPANADAGVLREIVEELLKDSSW